jgi:serine/threonine-protein kinase
MRCRGETSPPVEQGSNRLATVLTSGIRFGAYLIAGPLGAGGMGEVYRATDTNLKRDVAIKVLPESFAGAADRLARLQREAEVLASLNHANIAQIYGIERSAGTTALVMELVEGATLADRIAQGPISIDEALGISAQIADALEAAHVRGIVHRDLKPANIKLAPDGVVKVLDFGIAKALDVRVTTTPGMPALTTPAMTAAGILLGTAAYMAPEQARGRAVDQRADVWAFGCVLYEMLTGQSAFGGEDVTIVLARVLERSPDWSALPAAVPQTVRRTLELCLEKDPRQRIADIRDVKLALAGRLMIPAAPTTAGAGRRAWPMVAAALAAGAAIAGGAAWQLKPEPPVTRPRVVRASYDVPESFIFGLTVGNVVAIAPDGSRFAYFDATGLHVREVDASAETFVSGLEGRYGGLVFSPDGNSIAFFRDGQIHRRTVSGGPTVAIAALTNGAMGFSWGNDGTIVYAEPDGLWSVEASGGAPERLIASDDGGSRYRIRPQRIASDWVLYSQADVSTGSLRVTLSGIFARSLVTGEERLVSTQGSDARVLPSGHLVYVFEGVLYAAPFDAEAIAVTGPVVPVIEGVQTTITGIGQYDVSRAGDLVYIPGPTGTGAEDARLATTDAEGNVTAFDVTLELGRVRSSPDGTRFAVDSIEGGEAIIMIYDRAGASAPQRLTYEGRNSYPVWSPDGERIAYLSDREGDAAIFAQRVDGTGGAERLTTPAEGEVHVPESWSPDGKHVSFAAVSGNGTVYKLYTLALDDGSVAAFGNVEANEAIGSVFSPDGRWLAYHALPRGALPGSANSGIFVEPFPATGARYQAPKVERDFHPVWSRDGTSLHYVPSVASGQLATVSVMADAGLSFGAPRLVRFPLMAAQLSGAVRAFDTLPDGGFVGPLTDTSEGNALRPTEIHVAFNWFEELERLVPTKETKD